MVKIERNPNAVDSDITGGKPQTQKCIRLFPSAVRMSSALACIVAGHLAHHATVLHKRYFTRWSRRFRERASKTVPSKVPAAEKLFPFPQPLGVSYSYGSIGVGAR